MGKYIHLTLVLFVVAAFSGLILGVTNELTIDTIDEVKAEKLQNGLESIFPEINPDSEKGSSKLDITTKEILAVYEIKNAEDAIIGYVFKVDAPDAFDTIEALVGINLDGKVVGIDYLTVKETPGLGTKVKESKFTSKFDNVDTTDGIDTISGATYSSSAVIKAVNIALEYYDENLTE